MTNRTARIVVCSALGLALATLAGTGRALAQDTPAEGTPPAEGTAPPAAAAAPASSSGGGYLSPTDVTLRQGIEAMLREHAPAVKGLVDVTDHSSGSNPYFASAKK